ncbi:MAG: 5-formyltetrahydrofolate cyclo-ligase [Jiangellaceae bacterium]
MPASTSDAKLALRERIRANRAELDARALSVEARELLDVVLTVPEIMTAGRVAAYVSVGREPGTGPIIEALVDHDIEVLLPILLPDFDLDWARYTGPQSLAPAARGLLEPTGPALGLDAVTDADAVLVPGLAADRRGTRLGRGGGSYDRVLARLSARTRTYVLLHPGELLDIPIPKAAHDVPMQAAITRSGVHRLATPRPSQHPSPRPHQR